MQRRAGVLSERGDHVGIGERQNFGQRRAIIEADRRFLHQNGVEVITGVGCEMRLEIIGHFVFALHAHEGFRPAGIAAAVFLWSALELYHPCTGLARGNGRRQSGNTAADNYDVGFEFFCHGAFPIGRRVQSTALRVGRW